MLLLSLPLLPRTRAPCGMADRWLLAALPSSSFAHAALLDCFSLIRL
jgi:hypothetical protein